MSLRLIFSALFLALVSLLLGYQAFSVCQQETQEVPKAEVPILELLRVSPSSESIDYVKNKTQFQLHTLLTEQRHPKTWDLSERIQKDCEHGLGMLLSVDEDIVQKLGALARDKEALEQAAQAVEQALLSGQKIYVYGCGATGRLAKQMESTFWRPFWQQAKKKRRIWSKVNRHLGESIGNQLIGEMTGGDRALISSLEGFEDLLLIGRLQLEDRKVEKGDVVICVTEGGETSSVIGTILAALGQWKTGESYDPEETKKKLYFIYNNPDEKLLPFDRSRKVLNESGITKINLTTGPQSIAGSTRMQATTIETFVVGSILQRALDRTLRKFLSRKKMAALGFKSEMRLEDKLKEFSYILRQVKANLSDIAKFTELEAHTYMTDNFSTYFAQKGLITVFIDSTERSPTFRLFPLDTVKEAKRKSWIQVWTPAADLQDAWQAFLGRPFRGLSPEFYRKPFEEEINDFYLRRAALESLENAGNNQQFLYDFSFADFNLKNREPTRGDLAVAVLISPEEGKLVKKNSDFRKFIDLFSKKGASVAIILITDKSSKKITKLIRKIPDFGAEGKNSLVVINIDRKNDPLGINQQIALKILLNAHSTGVMARLGKVVGNTMTNVSPSNLKLIGRATYLVQSHVNYVLSHPHWVELYGIQRPISYGEANAVLFDAIDYLEDKNKEAGQTAEVAFSIIRILESFRLGKSLMRSKTLSMVKETGLGQYLSNVTSQ
jgi:N-acetylmuramic acid 6-phosphate etherase